MINRKKANHLKYEDIPKSTILGSTIRKTRNLMYGLALGALGLYGLSYYGYVDLSKKAEIIVKKGIEEKLDPNFIEDYAMELVSGKTNDAFIKNKDIFISKTKELLEENVNKFFEDNKEKFKQEMSENFKKIAKENGDKWFNEEKNKVHTKYKRQEIIPKTININIHPKNRTEEISQTIYSLNNNIKYIILVDKKNNLTKLIDCKTQNTIYTFNSTDGRGGPGPKESVGDNKTPEGVYYIKYYKTAKNYYNSLYGAIRLGINYPNKIDREQNRNGQGLLICGTGIVNRINAINNKQDATYGSIVLKDDDIIKLYNKINSELYKTAIVIENPNRQINLKNYATEIRGI